MTIHCSLNSLFHPPVLPTVHSFVCSFNRPVGLITDQVNEPSECVNVQMIHSFIHSFHPSLLPFFPSLFHTADSFVLQTLASVYGSVVNDSSRFGLARKIEFALSMIRGERMRVVEVNEMGVIGQKSVTSQEPAKNEETKQYIKLLVIFFRSSMFLRTRCETLV